MPVMKQLNVGGVTYDTVGEASVTQVVSTGTKIATVSIDGTSTDLYAPSGGSSVEPATAAPIVDGTAAVGSSVKYAREDHVHPTDTSRAAASDLAGKQETLVSGTNIKTINGNSILGSGDLTVGGGGGGYDLIIDVVIDTSGNLISHNVVAADCIDFVKSFVAGNDVRAVAYMRWHTYDDEDEFYAASGFELRLTDAYTGSYGVGQYEADGGWYLTFENVVMTAQGARAASFIQYRLSINGINDDPELSPTVTSTRTSVSLS